MQIDVIHTAIPNPMRTAIAMIVPNVFAGSLGGNEVIDKIL